MEGRNPILPEEEDLTGPNTLGQLPIVGACPA